MLLGPNSAPGGKILDVLFIQFAGRHYRKREDGAAIARASQRPAEIGDLFDEFLSD
jgi:hypothetical protein